MAKRCEKSPDGLHEFMTEDESYCYLCGASRPVPMVTVSMNRNIIFPPKPPKTRRQHIIDILTDSITDLLYYDRKEDMDLPRGGIGEAVRAGEITVDEMIKIWSAELREGIEND